VNNNRKLGATEQAMEIMNRYDKYFIVTASRIKGNLNEETLKQALDCLQNRHPRLKSRIIGSAELLHFETEGTPEIPLRVAIASHPEQWQEILQEELNEKLDSSKGLVRAVLVRIASQNDISYLIVTVHHAIALASTVVRLHSEILTYYQKISAGEKDLSIVSLPALSSIEELLPSSAKGVRGAIANGLFVLRTFLKSLWHRPISLGFDRSNFTNSERYNRFVRRQLDKNCTQKLRARCKQEKTTVQGALCAAMLLATTRIISVEKETVEIICHSSIDIRRFLDPVINDENAIVAFSYATGFFNVSKNLSFWQLARQVKSQLDISLMNRHELFSKVMTYKLMTDMSLANPKIVPDSVAVTNIGSIDIAKMYGSLELEEIGFFPVQSIVNNNFTVAATTFTDKMFLNFMFSEPLIERDKIEKLAENMLFYLVNC
jgi:hypothetical protein